MYMPNKFKPISKKLHRICCILMITVFTVSAQSTTADCPGQDFLSCPPQTCGNNGLEISYPFWVSQQQEISSCGYPMFQVTCSHNNYPVLTISNQDFVIKDIFYSDHSLLVAIAAVYTDGGGCPVPSKALSLLQNPTFKYTGNANLEFSFFYNCCFEPPEQINPFPVDCASNATHHSFGAFRNQALLGQYIDYSLCQSSVDVAVHVPAEYTNNFSSLLLGTNYVDILEMGFLLSWDTQACCDCHNTGGSCGYGYDAFVCLCDGWPHDATCSDDRDPKGRSKKKRRRWYNRRWFRIVVEVSIAAGAGAGAAAVTVYVVYRYREKIPPNNCISTHPPRYNFFDVFMMIQQLEVQQISWGGVYGYVYKGKHASGLLVAVKQLKESEANDNNFCNQIGIIYKVSHVNVVRFLGYCPEGPEGVQRRYLVYEFVSNGSLERFIKNDDEHLPWATLLRVAIGIAQGLDYLHCGCQRQVLHLDIKPSNILLDEDFCPKISDYGLATVCGLQSLKRNACTVEYMAPEIVNCGGDLGEVVSSKADVYSYGMLLVEMARGKNNNLVARSCVMEGGPEFQPRRLIEFPEWIYMYLQSCYCPSFPSWNGVTDLKEDSIARKLLIVGLWCIQNDPSIRPSMKEVITMLEGNLRELDIPATP